MQKCKGQVMFETKKTIIQYIVGGFFSHSHVYLDKLWPSVKETEHAPHILASLRVELSGLLHLSGQLHTISCFLPKVICKLSSTVLGPLYRPIKDHSGVKTNGLRLGQHGELADPMTFPYHLELQVGL